MTDKTELKRLAAAANAVMGDVRVDVAITSESGPNQDEIDSVTAFLKLATPAAVLALFAEKERLSVDEQETTDLCDRLSDLLRSTAIEVRGPEEPLKRHSFHDLPSRVKTVISERDQLKAENEALRDDIEQNQYDANAWRNGEESVWIEVFNSEGDDPFISAITGQITIEQLALIQAEILEYREDYFEKGSGLYVFRCCHCQAHHDNVGMTEPAHWETDFESYSPFPWEEGAAAMGKGEQS